MGPDTRVEAVAKGVIEDWAVLMLDDAAHTVPDEEAGDGQADEDTNDGHNCDPFLLGIPLLQPGLLYIALVHSA